MNNNRSIISGIDWWTIVLFIVIALFGWLNIYGSSYSFDQTSIWDFSNRAGKQLVWLITAVVMGTIILMIEEKAYDVLGYIFYGAMLILLIVTPIFARDIKGSLSWLTIGPISLQPAEFAKCFTAMAIAKFMSQYGYKVRDLRDLIIPFALIAIPMLIIMVAQRETGSALVFISFLLVFYRQGMSGYVLSWGAASILLFVLSLPCALGSNLLSFVTPFGEGSNIMDLEDFTVSNVLLPLGSFVTVLFCVSRRAWGWNRFTNEANKGLGIKVQGWMRGYMTYVLPCIVLALFIIGIIRFFN